jgi:hypothetical protein
MSETLKKEVIDFGQITVQSNTYLKPGQYVLHIESAKYEKPADKTPYLNVEFAGEQGKVDTKMYITAKALERLQYLHQEWVGKPCDKKFDSFDAVGAYYEKLLNDTRIKAKNKRMVIGGKDVNGKVYAEVGFTNYVIPDNVADFEEGAFEPGTPKYIMVIRKQVSTAPNTNNVATPTSGIESNSTEDDGLPF